MDVGAIHTRVDTRSCGRSIADGGRQRESDTRLYAERTLPVTTKLERRVRGLFFWVARIFGPCTPTNHRGDLPLEVSAAQGKSPVGRVAQRRNLALRDRVGEQPAVARASLSPASDRAFGRDNRT